MDATHEPDWPAVSGSKKGAESGARDVKVGGVEGSSQKGPFKKLREAPDVYFLKRRSIRYNMGMFSLITMAGLTAGMLIEDWISKRVEVDSDVAPANAHQSK